MYVQVGHPCATIKGNYPLCWWSDLRYDERFKSNPDNFLKSVFLSSSDALLDCHRFVLNYAIVMATLVDTGCMVTPSTCLWLLYFLLQHPKETERKQSVQKIHYFQKYSRHRPIYSPIYSVRTFLGWNLMCKPFQVECLCTLCTHRLHHQGLWLSPARKKRCWLFLCSTKCCAFYQIWLNCLNYLNW